MTDLRKAAEMALEAFKNTNYNADYSHYVINGVDGAELITALTQALAKPEQDISYTDIQMAELIMSDCGHSSDYTPLLERIAGRLATYRQALAQPEQEPVAYADPLDLVKDGDWDMFICKHASKNHEGSRFKIPLFTAPPSKPWVSLTDGEAYQLLVDYCDDDLGLLNAIEAALRSKNNG